MLPKVRKEVTNKKLMKASSKEMISSVIHLSAIPGWKESVVCRYESSRRELRGSVDIKQVNKVDMTRHLNNLLHIIILLSVPMRFFLNRPHMTASFPILISNSWMMSEMGGANLMWNKIPHGIQSRWPFSGGNASCTLVFVFLRLVG